MSSYWFWLTVGFVGQSLFTARFVVQWLASERERAVVVPSAFWWLSILGASALLSYAVHNRDPVIVLGQSMGLFVYVRNLSLESRKRKSTERAACTLDAAAPPAPHFQGGGRAAAPMEAALATRGARDVRGSNEADGSARM